jgi:hypothetical protein
VYQS